jgi:glucosamine--fructose-6-phosphate aminotransferase (isomerizing)
MVQDEEDMPTLFEQEIYEQPVVLARLLTDGRTRAEEIAGRITAFAPHAVFIAARGTSDNAARYAQYLFGAHNRLAVGLTTPSLFTIYDAPPEYRGMLVIGISQSGQSPDIVTVIETARMQGALTLAITNDTASPLATAAELCFPLHAGVERAVAATKTYTTQLTALAMLSTALAGAPDLWNDLMRLPDAVREAIQRNTGLAERTAAWAAGQRFVVIGRGFNYATAFEIALKLQETCYVVAEPFSSADFLHGPIAMIDSDFPIVLVAPTGRTFADLTGLLPLLTERNASVSIITDATADPAVLGSAVTLPMAPGTPEWLSPIPAVVAGQLFALAQATLRGYDPDQPRGLTKITETY